MSSTIPRIIQLSQNVVDKIAAGEVVIRPVNAVKELVENSLDAGATEINVSIRAGGLELIKIQDNGHGINREELSIACCRFTTSKLREFEDLQKIQTFGFRGEALASISLVSNLIITSRTANEICASKACYKEGKLIGQIERSAGLLGTTICVEKLFQNMPSRLAAFRQPNEEAHKIADILIRYSIHYPKISFSYRRLDGNGYDFRTSGDGDQHCTIKRLLHEKASNGLTNLEFNNSSLHFSAKICLATPVAIFTSKAVQTRNDKIKIFHLFVNGRSVESFRLQKSFDSIFTSRDLLCPFASFSLLIDPQRVDVNIHPTKKLVYFLCEDDIIEFIGKQIEKFVNETQSRQSIQINNLNEELKEDCSKKRNKNNRKRKAGNEKEIIFEENGKNLNNLNCSLPSSKSSSFLNVSSKVQSNPPKVAPKNKIRVDFLNRSLDEFVLTNEDLNLRPNSSVRLSLLKKVAFEEENNEGGSNINPIEINEIERENEENIGGKTNNKVDCCIPREFSFNSLVNLRKEICQKADNKLVELFKKHLLIGFFDSENALIQSENNVFLINNNEILRQFFYQLIIFSFGNIGAYDLIIQSENSSTKNLSIYQLLLLEEENEKKIANLCQILVKNREILWDFFSIKIILNSINEDAVLAAIPCLINGYLPEMEGLPLLLYKLANVNFEDEKSCYSEIAFALADFHLPSISEEDYENLNEEQQNIFKKQNLRVERTLRSLIFPALRNRFLPSSELEEYIKELTSTAKAFKHFGRC